MHISEGVLSGPVLVVTTVIAITGTVIGLKKLDNDRLPHAAVLSLSFFVASLVHVPLGPSNVHLILNGIVGLILGWAAFPAILVGLALQAMLFQFGGITTLGVNTIIMALPAVLCSYIFSPMVSKKSDVSIALLFAAGFFSVLFSAVLAGMALAFTGEHFFKVSFLLVIAHLPVMFVEGFITAFCVAFLKKVQPEIFSQREK